MVLGYIGYGEAAFEMSRGLKSAGLTNIYAFDVMMGDSRFGQQIQQRAEQAQVALCQTAGEVIGKADVIMAAVPANFTLSTCEGIVKHLSAGKVYVDVSAADPYTKQRVAALVAETGAEFVDVAMMGVLPKFKHKVPMLACGNGAEHFAELMAPYEMNISCVGKEPGKASGIKLIRSLCLKGMAGLLIELLEAATTLDVADQVLPGLFKTLDECSFEQTMDRLVTGTALHGARRAAELQGCVTMLDAAGLDSSMTKAAIAKHEQIAALGLREYFVDKAPKHWDEVLRIMNEKKATNQ